MTCLLRDIGSCWPTLDADKVGHATPFVPFQGNLTQGSPFFVLIRQVRNSWWSANMIVCKNYGFHQI
jgi:hypothetical protein